MSAAKSGVRVILRTLAPYARRHRVVFVKGGVAALFVVAAKLALPWPLRFALDLSILDSRDGARTLELPVAVDPVLLMGGAFLGTLLILGLSDLLARLYFARFAIGTVRDLRADAFKAAVSAEADDASSRSGDMVARLVGDTARLKEGLKGFFVHVVTNGLVFTGVSVILLIMNVQIGLVFAAAGLCAGAVMTWGAARIFRVYRKQRQKEGRLADTIHYAFGGETDETHDRFAKVNRSSGRHEATTTRIQGIATWSTHGIYGLAVVVALYLASGAVKTGQLTQGEMVSFMMYALIMRGPIIRLARQGTRTGKILGAAYRVVDLLQTSRTKPESAPSESRRIEEVYQNGSLEEERDVAGTRSFT